MTKPTFEHAMDVYADLTKQGAGKPPSFRVFEEVLATEGYDISYRTLQRWVENGKPGQVAMNHAVKRKGVKHEIAKALVKISDGEKLAADQMKVDGIAPAVQTEIAEGKRSGDPTKDAAQIEADIIDRRIEELLLKSAPELDVSEQKARKIFNIVLMEAATRRANIMTLIPKETAALVDAMTTASKQTLTGGLDGEKPPASKTIDGDMVDITPATPLQSAIGKFLHDEGIAG